MLEDGLYPCRLAARALALVLDRVGLAQMAVKFNPDDSTQVIGGAELGEIRFFVDATSEHARSLARVFLRGPVARVYVERVRDLVRTNHRRDFRPSELGLPASLDIEVDLAGVIESEGELLRNAPPRPVQRRRLAGEPRVISALSALRSR